MGAYNVINSYHLNILHFSFLRTFIVQSTVNINLTLHYSTANLIVCEGSSKVEVDQVLQEIGHTWYLHMYGLIAQSI
jgi:hypothetical protein